MHGYEQRDKRDKRDIHIFVYLILRGGTFTIKIALKVLLHGQAHLRDDPQLAPSASPA